MTTAVCRPPKTSGIPNFLILCSTPLATTSKLPTTIGTKLVDKLYSVRHVGLWKVLSDLFLLLSCHTSVRRHSEIFNQPPLLNSINKHNIRLITFHLSHCHNATIPLRLRQHFPFSKPVLEQQTKTFCSFNQENTPHALH